MTDDEAPVITGTATANQLSKLFKIDKNRIRGLLVGVAPVSKRKTFPVYDIREAAAMLVEVGYDVEERLRHMNPADLPPLLGKEMWNGQRARLAFEEDQGDLWRTADVLEALSLAFKEVALQLKLMRDTVERQATLSPRQREIIGKLTDAATNGCREALVTKFAGCRPPVDNVSGAAAEL